MFDFLRNSCTVVHRDCTILHSYQQWTKVPVSAHPHRHLVLCFLLSFNNSLPSRYEVVTDRLFCV